MVEQKKTEKKVEKTVVAQKSVDSSEQKTSKENEKLKI